MQEAHPGLWAEAVASFHRLAPTLGIRKPEKLTGQLVLSSAEAHAPYDFASTGMAVFHLRGVKRVWVYPINETSRFRRPQWRPSFRARIRAGICRPRRLHDAAAWRFDIVPGEALAMPLYAPHRVENQEDICVTLILTYETAEVPRHERRPHRQQRPPPPRPQDRIDGQDPLHRPRRSSPCAAGAFRLVGVAKKRPTRIAREFVTAEPAVEIIANDNRLAA